MRSLLRLALTFVLLGMTGLLGTQLYSVASFPRYIRLLPGEEYPVRLGSLLRAQSSEAWLDANQAGQLLANSVGPGRAILELSLFGIPVRRAEVDVVPRLHLIPGGHSVGVLMGDGVTVTQLASVRTVDGTLRSPAQEAGLRPGDTIRQIAGRPVTNGSQLEWAAQEYGARREPVPLLVERDGRTLEVRVQPVLTRSGEAMKWVLGLWVKDEVAGVGTLTFWDPVTLRFGALGHQIAGASRSDGSKGEPIGRLVAAAIHGVTPGQRGRPGEKEGYFSQSSPLLGRIDKNTAYGIYGELERALEPWRQPIPVALAHEVEVGPATILTVLNGLEVEEFEVQITSVSRQSGPTDKGLQLRVTDPRLLSVTNGIVQGMSGSPIIQNGRIVGAVTHVFVNDPQRGYGILAEWMAYEAGLELDRQVLTEMPRAG